MSSNPGSPDQRERTVLINEAAERLGVSRRTVYYRISDGRLQTIRTRCGSQRVLLSSIEALLREEEERERAWRTSVRHPSESEPRSRDVETLARDT